ncbi:MAG: aminotransferase class III-fold pyridoxal phosphate-dependent enzyme, partial [Candidatus Omnitrophica bacterium]|nr:aminotransferase class III-fold pyridoxal phosphate-dependent enzyme [Candidatus Omnitrophota bacterium]
MKTNSVSGFELRVSRRRETRNPKPETRNFRWSSRLLEEAQRYLVGGVNSPVRAFRQVGGDPLMLVQARGVEVRDPGGRRWLDFIMGWGALLLGHNALPVVQALQRGMKQGILMGLTHPAEVELARLIVEAVPSVEQVRFMVSGTEACMTAVRLARAQTGRTKIVVFEGCYHGHADSLMAGKTTSVASVSGSEVISVPFNDLDAFEMAIRRHGDEVACVIVEPVAANMGVVVPEPGFLQRLRTLTSRHGILLIFDEVVTGFRV